MQDDDVTLLRRYVEEDVQEAFTQVVRRNMNMVYSTALRRVGGDAHLARDVAQDVFIALARHAGSLARQQVLAGWFHTATRNAAANRVRGEVRRRRREGEAHTMHDILQGGDGDVDWSQVAPVLDRTMDELAERDRLALLLRFFDQRTFAEIGAALRITEDAARMRVERALDKLQARLTRQGIRSPVALLGAAMTQHAVGAAPAELAATVAGTALAAPAAGWVQALGWSGTEAAVMAAALLVIGGAFWTGHSARDAAASAAAARIIEQNAITRIEQRVHELEARRRDPEPARATPVDFAAPPAAQGAEMNVRLAGGRRTGLAAVYDPFYRTLGLTPEQIARFETIGVSGPGSALWVFDQAATAREATFLSAAEAEQQLRALLGESGYAHYRDYQRAVPAREAVMQLASAVYLTDPLDRAQGERLTALMWDASRDYQAGGSVDLAGLDWSTLVASAGEVLSPGQMNALAAVRQRAAFYGALQQRLAQRVLPPPASAP